MSPRRWAPAVLGSVAIALAACQSSDVAPSASHDLAEPWQPDPFGVSLALTSQAELACHGLDAIPSTVPLVVLDARGLDTLFLVFAGEGREMDCIVTRGSTGAMTASNVGGASDVTLPELGPDDVTILDFASSELESGGSVTTMVGRVGTDVASVDLVTGSSGELRALRSPNGWFAAWLPAIEGEIRVNGYDADGNLVGSAQ